MKKVLFGFVLVLCLAAGWYGLSVQQSAQANNQQSDAQHSMSGGTPPQAVTVLTLKPQNVDLQHILPGRISAYRQAEIRPQVNGIITKRLFEEGAHIEKGAQLYQIDDTRYKAALNSAEADLKSAQANVKSIQSRADRYRDLVKINAVSQQEYDDIQAELDQAKAHIDVAQAAVQTAQVNLDYTKVYAPISGRISRSLVTEGALVSANQTQDLAIITQLDPIYVDMQQSGAEALAMRNKMIANAANIPVSLILDEGQNISYPHKGDIKFSEVTIDPSTGSTTLRALIPNPDYLLLPGLFVRAEIDLGHNNVLLIPQRATTRLADGSLTVWVVDDQNIAHKRGITVQSAYQDQWVVLGGVTAGERIIMTGYQKISDNAPVSVSPWMETAQIAKDE